MNQWLLPLLTKFADLPSHANSCQPMPYNKPIDKKSQEKNYVESCPDKALRLL
jgi:hypothetical protein